MTGRNVKRTSRGRKLTRREAARYKKIRAQVEAERPEIDARIRAKLAAAEAMRLLGGELRTLRESQGKSLADLRALTGMDRAALSRLERGERENASMETLVRYAQALGKTLTLSLENGNGDAGG